MRFHPKLIFDLARYVLGKRWHKIKRFPLVLMLEPLYACNLACDGCGRIREYQSFIHEKLSLADCLAAVEEAGTPIVSIAGGEPTIYPSIIPLVEELILRKKHIYLCTNGLALEGILLRLKPSLYLNINVSLDALRENHNRWRNNSRVFDAAITGIKKAKQAGFRVVTNTTIYKNSDMKEIDRLFDLLTRLGVDGMIISPGFGYENIDKEIVLTRRETYEKFRHLDSLRRKYKLLMSPLYAKFLKGLRDFPCAPWGNPTRNVKGWKSPCYLITDTHFATFEELMNETPWERYGTGRDSRCKNCMMHVGYEAAAVQF